MDLRRLYIHMLCMCESVTRMVYVLNSWSPEDAASAPPSPCSYAWAMPCVVPIQGTSRMQKHSAWMFAFLGAGHDTFTSCCSWAHTCAPSGSVRRCQCCCGRQRSEHGTSGPLCCMCHHPNHRSVEVSEGQLNSAWAEAAADEAGRASAAALSTAAGWAREH